MTERTERLRRESLDTPPRISAERAVLLTGFYEQNAGKWSVPVTRARSFVHLCEHKTIHLGDGELIVGERGPAPKAVPTFPELTCHSEEDLRILNSRPKTWYRVDEECLRLYREKVIPYWRGRTMRERIFAELSPEWVAAYEAGVFTEFMEQRAPGHTVLDDKIYRRGLRDFKRDIEAALDRLDFLNDPEALDQREALKSFATSCDAVMRFAERHVELARERAETEPDAARKAELLKIAEVCERVPAQAPRDFHEALQAYWFCHLAVVTELNGWDAFSPGHLDQHLLPFYERGLADGTLTRESARELLECFFIKFNNHPAPPKVGVTAAESGTYTDFANINLGGLLCDGTDGSNAVSHLLLEIVDGLHLLQPSSNVQVSRKSPEGFLKHALRVIGKGYGFPSVFNADAVVQEQLRQGKSLEDARAGGCSGCVEVGAFGKEAYILTGYFNLPKVFELALHNGVDPRTGRQLGPRTAEADSFARFDELFAAYRAQFRHFLDLKLRGNRIIQRLYATQMPAPFLSVLTDDCIRNGRDYNAGGARYNNTYVQFVGLGTLTDSLSAVKQGCFAGMGSTRGPRVPSGGPPDVPASATGTVAETLEDVSAGGRNEHAGGVCSPSERAVRLFATEEKRVSLEQAVGARYSKRNLPHFEKPWAIYHITFSAIEGLQLAPEDRNIVMDCIRHWDGRRYRLSAACVMPDHVHLIIQPGIESRDVDGEPIFFSLSTILHTIKSFTAHRVNQRVGKEGGVWQKESFDRYVRSDADLAEKFHYVCRNPWDAGIAALNEPYAWVWPAEVMGSTRGPRVPSGGPPDAPVSATGTVAEVLPDVSAGGRNEHAGGVCSPWETGGVCSPPVTLGRLVAVLTADFADHEPLRQRLLNKTPKYGNDDPRADEIMVRIFNTCVEELDGRPDGRGGCYRVEMLPTTCHVYFGSVTGATPDGRHAGRPLSEGISPVQGADRHGPTAVVQSAAKMDHLKSGGTLLNLKFTPSLVATDEGLDKWGHLVRGYFRMDGHHVQFNVVDADTLRRARENPEEHRDLIVRVAGYSDYFCDLSEALQEEIIQRTGHEGF